MTYMHRKC
jgi:hypothetical protein